MGFDDVEEKSLEEKQSEQFRRESGETFKEEYASEVAPTVVPPVVLGRRALNNPEEDRPDEPVTRSQEGTEVRSGGRAVGWVAFILAIISLFVYPVLMGAGAIVLGIIAYVQGSRALGGWSVVIGGIALISYLVLVPYYT